VSSPQPIPATYHYPESIQSLFWQKSTTLYQATVVEDLWNRDHTLWKPLPTEIENRLGWLDLPEDTLEKLPDIERRVKAVLSSNPTDVVLMGMGGSSLCPEVFRRSMGSAEEHPTLHVLDSTNPDWVRRVTGAIDPKRTLFIVASKSGGTIEVMSAFNYFWEIVSAVVTLPGKQFIAITDPGTSLVDKGRECGFADVFQNREDIGGRFSALSFFGMVPALLMGLDVRELLDRAKVMAEECRQPKPEDNPGAQLGLFLTVCVDNGRDKLTLLTDPKLDGLGLWIEQLIAESTGKEGKGILPVAGEPILDPRKYGDDRMFVGVTLPGEDSIADHLQAVKDAGHPTAHIELSDHLDLGAEFYRWEFATALASHFLIINAFDQPNVQLAKTLTGEVIDEYKQTSSLAAAPETEPSASLLEDAKPPAFLAIMAYLLETDETEAALTHLRKAVAAKYGIATTSGYGPRFLHSTGQYHKGGPNTGLFLQLVQQQDDLPIPGQEYGFGTLCEAQSIGDCKALLDKDRRIARVELGPDAAEGIRELAENV